MAENCFVCGEPNPGKWLPELDIRVCSDECMEAVLEEYVKIKDPMHGYDEEERDETTEQNSDDEQSENEEETNGVDEESVETRERAS